MFKESIRNSNRRRLVWRETTIYVRVNVYNLVSSNWCTQVYLGTPRYKKVYIGTHRYKNVYIGTHRYKKVYIGTHRYKKVSTGTHRYKKVHIGVYRYTEVLKVTHLHPFLINKLFKLLPSLHGLRIKGQNELDVCKAPCYSSDDT